jgi:outer membrane protein assembly factor BamE (lipoprotein component of BamABCDE complex)
MKFFLNIIAAAFLTLNLSGCIVVGGGDWNNDDNDHWQERQQDNKRIISQLEINDSRKTIIEQLGAPDLSEAFTKDNDNYRVLFYRTQHERSDGETSKDETTPLVFKNGKLIGWGMDALSSVR